MLSGTLRAGPSQRRPWWLLLWMCPDSAPTFHSSSCTFTCDTVNSCSREKWTRPWTSPAGSPSGSPQKLNCQHCKHSRLHGRHWLFLTNYLCQSRSAAWVQEQGVHLTTITKTVRMKTGRPSQGKAWKQTATSLIRQWPKLAPWRSSANTINQSVFSFLTTAILTVCFILFIWCWQVFSMLGLLAGD